MSNQPISPDEQADNYRLFILRVWQETPDGPQRYMLKAANSDHRYIFADAHGLAEFLEKDIPQNERKNEAEES